MAGPRRRCARRLTGSPSHLRRGRNSCLGVRSRWTLRVSQPSTKGRGENATTETIWISSPFEIIGACRDPHGRGWGKWLRWRDGDGRLHTTPRLGRGFAGRSVRAVRRPCRRRPDYQPEAAKGVPDLLGGCNVKGRVTVVHRTGWHNIGDHRVFVLPAEAIGPKGSERVILDASAAGPYETRGTLKDWQDGIGALAAVMHCLCWRSRPPLPVRCFTSPGRKAAASISSAVRRSARRRSFKRRLPFGGVAIRPATSGHGARRPTAWRALRRPPLTPCLSSTNWVLWTLATRLLGFILCLANGRARRGRRAMVRCVSQRVARFRPYQPAKFRLEPSLPKTGDGRRAPGNWCECSIFLPIGALALAHSTMAELEDDAGKLAKAFKRAAISAYGTAGPEFVRRLIDDDVTGDDVRS